MARMNMPGQPWSAAFPPQSYWDADASPTPDEDEQTVPKYGKTEDAGNNVGAGKNDVGTLIGDLTANNGSGKVVIRKWGPAGGDAARAGLAGPTGPQ